MSLDKKAFKAFAKNNMIALIVAAVGLAASCAVLAGRAGVESRDKSYDIVLDYQETEDMAKQDGVDVSVWLARFKDMGISKVGLAEESLKSLQEGERLPVSAEVMGLLTQEAAWREDYPEAWIESIQAEGFDKYDLMVEMRSREAYDFVVSGLLGRYGEDRVRVFRDGGGGYALLDGTPQMTLYTPKYKEQNSKGGGFLELIDIADSKLAYLSLGLLPEKVEAIQGLGMEIVPRTASYNTWNDSVYARAVLEDYGKNGIYAAPGSYMIAGGEGVPGYDDGIGIIEGYLEEKGVTLGLIEDTTQLQNIMQSGILELNQRGSATVRVFSVWNYIQNRYQYYGYEGAKEIENTLFRAVAERNIRVIYYKPIRELKDLHTYVTDVDEYREMFASLEERLGEHGFSFGQASVMEPYRAPFAAKLLIAFGCAASGALLLGLLLPLPGRVRKALPALGALCVLASFWVAPNTTELVASLMNALIFACLSVMAYTRLAWGCAAAGATGAPPPLGKALGAGAVTLVAALLIALAGGAMTAAPLSSVSYMLEIDIFRGVKLAQILPIAFFAVAYLACFGLGGRRRLGHLEFGDVKALMNTSIKVWMALLAALFAAGGAYYIMRTGHESVDVSGAEMLFRNTLEELLLARPRTKEFLFGFPCIMLMIYAAFRRMSFWTVIFGFCGVIGVTSVVNTFMHIRTPLYLGFARTGYSVILGLIAGVVAVLVFHALCMAYRSLSASLRRAAP
ncbi:MAG: DUF5693 family protein [Clostridiales Family XIII bacterium]|jgi:hypothetical protein|nr:DUF5693 family protein [Clostridiales Family XIII bacterium]